MCSSKVFAQSASQFAHSKERPSSFLFAPVVANQFPNGSGEPDEAAAWSKAEENRRQAAADGREDTNEQNPMSFS
jgi:hypothetical protein